MEKDTFPSALPPSKLFWVGAFFFTVITFSLVYWKLAIRSVEEVVSKHSKYQVSKEPFTPILQATNLDESKVALGEKLFNEPRLSQDNRISCGSCHKLASGGADQLPFSVGMNGQRGYVNTPTVFNASYNFRQFWDGRAETLEDQIDGPTHAANEMGSNWTEITTKLRQAPDYVTAFGLLYPEGIQPHTIKDAIATFERTLITPHSRFDQYLQGDQSALSAEEQEGYQIFKTYGCVSCHQGVNIGGNMYQKFGVMGNYFKDRRTPTTADYGRYNVTKNESDKFIFKVPSLRNVALTAPYFHDGSAANLEEAITIMGKYQLGRDLNTHEITVLTSFLKSLTGNYTRYKS